jgi:DNA-directed RNA polymerase specialized sigma24 family protein|tara:strand:+ start:2274 stop:2864 length:591 start_codon:yes stop_codon:yes gene_type:complete
MEDSINELVKNEEIWFRYLKHWGCNKDTAKDLVQEMYIQIDTYLKKHNTSIMYNDNEINHYFVYVTLYNMFCNLKRAEKKVNLVSLDYMPELSDEPYDETENENYQNYRAIQEWFLHDDFLAFTQIVKDEENVLEDYDREKMYNFYQRKIFEEVFLNNKKISKLSRDTNISYYSLYNTVQNIKKQIKEYYGSKTWG